MGTGPPATWGPDNQSFSKEYVLLYPKPIASSGRNVATLGFNGTKVSVIIYVQELCKNDSSNLSILWPEDLTSFQ